jgi:hypothetical protein
MIDIKNVTAVLLAQLLEFERPAGNMAQARGRSKRYALIKE